MNIKSIEIKAIDIMKTTKIMQPIYRRLKTRQNQKRFKVESINVFEPLRTGFSNVRFNLVLPTLRKTRVFAGISSAISFFNSLTRQDDYCRIIIIGDEEYDSKMTYSVPGYEHNKTAIKQLLFATDTDTIDIGENDIFVFTSWKTAFSFQPIFQWQKKKYKLTNRKAVYLIQDYEPGFFSWSSEYVLAESTYSDYPNDILAVFNSKELYNFFNKEGYSFAASYFFKPVLNENLKDKLLDKKDSVMQKRKKQILIYGRPSEDRNVFEILRYSLKKWSNDYKRSKEWTIVSLGEGFTDIKLDNNIIVSKGKVSLEEYANHMFTSYVGISLMVSPHPSYPPLEMSTFGVRTLTNKFAGKDLALFNKNIISLDKCSPKLIVETLSRVCDEYDGFHSELAINEEYLNGKGFIDIAKMVRKVVFE